MSFINILNQEFWCRQRSFEPMMCFGWDQFSSWRCEHWWPLACFSLVNCQED